MELDNAQSFEPAAAPMENAADTSAQPSAPVEQKESLDALWARATETNQPQQVETQESQVFDEQTETVAEPTDENAETESDEADLLAEFDVPRLPDAERLKELLKRSPDTSKVEITQAIENARETEGVIEKLGGAKAVPILENIAQSLFTPEVTHDSVEGFFEQVYSVNPQLVAEATVQMVNAVWDAPTWQGFLESKLQERFGQGYDAERIANLVRLDASGLFETDDFKYLLEEQGLDGATTENPRVQQLEQQLAEYKRQDVQRQATEQQQQTRQTEYLDQLNEKSDAYVMDSVMELVTPILTQIGWTRDEKDPEQWGDAKDIFGEMRNSWIKNQINSSAEAKNIKFLVKNGQAFNANGQPTAAYTMQTDKIASKLRAATVKAARLLQPTFAKSLSMTRNAVPKKLPPENPPPTAATQQLQQPPPTTAPSQVQPRRYMSQEELDRQWNNMNTANAQTIAMQTRQANGR